MVYSVAADSITCIAGQAKSDANFPEWWHVILLFLITPRYLAVSLYRLSLVTSLLLPLSIQALVKMAQNEKAQSKLYKFKEKQSVDMGMGDRQKGDRRPRMASSVTNLRDCERWRSDIMRDISRKVSKIQDCQSIQI